MIMKFMHMSLLLAACMVAGCNATGSSSGAQGRPGTEASTATVAVADTFATPSGKKIVITPIKHGSLEINYNGLEFQIDPVGKGVEPATDYSRFRKADYILVTHEHFDHLDPAAITAVSKPSTVLVTNARCAAKLGQGTVMKNGDRRTLAPGITVEAVPAYNTTPGHTQFHPKGRDNGYVLGLDGFNIYIGGDTEDIPEMARLKNIDVAFLPVNQPYTMTPIQLRRAAIMVHPRVLYPYHYGLTDTATIREELKGLRLDLRLRNFK